MKKNIIITEQEINNIILQTLNEIAQKRNEIVQETNWKKDYIKLLQKFNKNNYDDRDEWDFSTLVKNHLWDIATSERLTYWANRAIGRIKGTPAVKNSASTINPNKITHDVFNMVVTFFIFAFTGFDIKNIKEIAKKEKGIYEKKESELTKVNDKFKDNAKLNVKIKEIEQKFKDKVKEIEQKVDIKIKAILVFKKKLLEFVDYNYNELLKSVQNKDDSYFKKLQGLSRPLFSCCYSLYEYVYGIKDSVILTQKSNMYDDNFDIKDENSNHQSLFDGLEQTVKQIQYQYKDLTPNYSNFYMNVINWVNSSKNKDIIKQKFDDILRTYREGTSVKDSEYLGIMKGVKFTLLALYLGRDIPNVINRLSRIHRIDISGWTGFLTELEEVNNSIANWETLDQLTDKKVNKNDIRDMLYELIKNELKKHQSITYDNYIFDLFKIFIGNDIEGGENKSKSFAMQSGYDDGIIPKGIDVYSYFQGYKYYFDKLGGTLYYKDLEKFLRQKISLLNDEKKHIPLIKYIYGIFIDWYRELKQYFNENNKTLTRPKKEEIREKFFKKIDNVINNEINKINNGEIKLKDSDIKTNVNNIKDQSQIAESKIKQIIYETIKRYLK
jgi:hypothetical protein